MRNILKLDGKLYSIDDHVIFQPIKYLTPRWNNLYKNIWKKLLITNKSNIINILLDWKEKLKKFHILVKRIDIIIKMINI